MPSDTPELFAARFNDGHTGGQLAVAVRAVDAGLIIEGEDGAELGRWGWAEIRLTERATEGRPLRLANRVLADARLTFDDHAILPILTAHAPYLRGEPLTRERIKAMSAFGGTIAAVIAFLIWGLPLLAGPLARIVPVSWEKQIGDDSVDMISTIFADSKKPCSGADAQKILDDLARRLVDATDTPYDIRVSVADGKMVNAFAVPGGRVVLFRGLIENAKSSDQVAGVLAHELAHVIHRHPTRGMITSIGWSVLLSAFTGGASLSNEVVAKFAAHLATSAHSRELEAEADAMGVDMLERAGIGSAGLVEFFRKLGKSGNKGFKIPEYLSSHPMTDKRIDAIEKRSKKMDGSAMNERDWATLRKICG